MRTDNEVLWDDAEAKLRAQERRRRIDRCEELLEIADYLRGEVQIAGILEGASGAQQMTVSFYEAAMNGIAHVESCLRAEIAAARGKGGVK